MKFCYDASIPVHDPPAWPACAFYIGGTTPHVVTDTEFTEMKARYRVPIYVHVGSDSTQAGQYDARSMLAWAHVYRVPAGSTLVIDTETSVYHDYLAAMDHDIVTAGYKLMNYGSLDSVIRSQLTSGGRWSAHWDDAPKIDPGYDIRATQFADATMLHTDYDASVFSDAVTLWDTAPPAPNLTSWEELTLIRVAEAQQSLASAAHLLKTHLPK